MKNVILVNMLPKTVLIELIIVIIELIELLIE